MAEYSFHDYNDKLKIQEVLQDIGYVLSKRDGMRWPSFVRIGSDGKRISGDKFLVNPRYNTCFQPPERKSYNPVSFIIAFPHLFKDYHQGMDKFLLANNVCRRLLNLPPEVREERRIDYSSTQKPFNIEDYKLERANGEDFSTLGKFYPYFKYRGISPKTQIAFQEHFFLASKQSEDKSTTMTNLSFPLHRPGDDKIYGFEERGKPRMDGSSGYKGKSAGADGSRALWIANLSGKPLSEAQNLYWFESAYDAMAFWQLRQKNDWKVRDGVFLSTGGNPTYLQFKGVQEITPKATHYLCFDVDDAGKKFAENFQKIGEESDITKIKVPEDMKAYQAEIIARMENDRVSSVKGIVYFPTERQAQALPPELKEKYYKLWDMSSELKKMEKSGICATEDIEKQKGQIKQQREDFIESMNKKLGIQHEAHTVKTVRLEPLSGCKDWNEELLSFYDDKKEAPMQHSYDSGIDIDGDGVNEQIEEEVPVDEKKHLSKAR